MLHRSRERSSDAGQDMSRTGYGFDQVVNRLALLVELDNKALLALFDMEDGRSVHEPKARRGVDDFDDAVNAYRPKEGGVGFHRNQLSGENAGSRVSELHPFQIKLLPTLVARACSRKDFRSASDLGPGEVVRKALGRRSERAVVQCQ